MSFRPGALTFFSTLMPMSSSAAVNALVNPGSSGTVVGRGVLSVVCSVVFRYVGVGVPLGSQWCYSATSACTGRHRACLSWITPSCCCVSCLLIRSGSAILRRSSEMALISSSPSVMVLSGKG